MIYFRMFHGRRNVIFDDGENNSRRDQASEGNFTTVSEKA